MKDDMHAKSLVPWIKNILSHPNFLPSQLTMKLHIIFHILYRNLSQSEMKIIFTSSAHVTKNIKLSQLVKLLVMVVIINLYTILLIQVQGNIPQRPTGGAAAPATKATSMVKCGYSSEMRSLEGLTTLLPLVA